MSGNKIAVFGATGLVGSRLCEVLFHRNNTEFKAFINSFGSAYKIARFPIEIEQVNLLDRKRLNRVLKGFNIVVNCSRGDKSVMIQGLKNLINASKKNSIEKFIHISSVLIFGEDPPIESQYEDCKPNPGRNEYGAIKLKQDNMLFNSQKYFQTISLCPPNIQGPYSPFSIEVLNLLQKGYLPLVDNGITPCNVVHVDNLVWGIICAINSTNISSQRFFVKDEGNPTWREYLTCFENVMKLECKIEHIPIYKLKIEKSNLCKGSGFLAKNFKHLLSSELRNSLSGFSGLGELNKLLLYKINCLSPQWQTNVKRLLGQNSMTILNGSEKHDYHFIIKNQARKVNHSIEKAKRILNYDPLMNYVEAINNTKQWFEFVNYVR